jgi:hypothetical protein
LDEIAPAVYEENSGQAFYVSGNTQKKTPFYQRAIIRPKIIQPENRCAQVS